MKRVINTSLFLSCLNNINSVTLNKNSKIFINYIEFCNFKDNLNVDIKDNTMKANEFLKLFKNDTYKTCRMIGIMVSGGFCQKISYSLQSFVFRLIFKPFLYDIAVNIVQSTLARHYQTVEYHNQNYQCNIQIRG